MAPTRIVIASLRRYPSAQSVSSDDTSVDLPGRLAQRRQRAEGAHGDDHVIAFEREPRPGQTARPRHEEGIIRLMRKPELDGEHDGRLHPIGLTLPRLEPGHAARHRLADFLVRLGQWEALGGVAARAPLDHRYVQLCPEE